MEIVARTSLSGRAAGKDADPERTARFTNAEDTILAKLRWYRLGGDSSERQWRDVEGITAVQGERLNWSYLRRQAAELGVADLLARLPGGAG